MGLLAREFCVCYGTEVASIPRYCHPPAFELHAVIKGNSSTKGSNNHVFDNMHVAKKDRITKYNADKR